MSSMSNLNPPRTWGFTPAVVGLIIALLGLTLPIGAAAVGALLTVRDTIKAVDTFKVDYEKRGVLRDQQAEKNRETSELAKTSDRRISALESQHGDLVKRVDQQATERRQIDERIFGAIANVNSDVKVITAGVAGLQRSIDRLEGRLMEPSASGPLSQNGRQR